MARRQAQAAKSGEVFQGGVVAERLTDSTVTKEYMSHASLIDLLDLWGLDLREGALAPVRVLRHAHDDGVPRRLYALGIQELERYQAAQKTRIFGDAKILVSFINTGGHEAEFVGVYRVYGVKEGNEDAPSHETLPQDLLERCNSNFHYKLCRDTEFDQFRERIRIEWDSLEHRWVRRYQDANRRIVAVKGPSDDWLVPDSRESLLNLKVVPADDDSDFDGLSLFKEGGRSLRSHFTIERNGALVQESKARFKRLHGRLYCEACGFDFVKVYGEDYIECHHTVPVHELPSNGSTSIDDVVLLCSNCHRMVHRRKEWITVDQLRSLFEGR